MKKLLLSFGLSFLVIINAFAANTLAELNTRIAELLAPMQNNATTAKLTFSALETNDLHALKLAFNGHYHKTGSQNTFEVKVDNFNYVYGDGLNPATTIKGSIGLNFTKILSQNDINILVPRAAEAIREFIKNAQYGYGEAVSVESKVTSTTQDDNENYKGFTALISVKIDLTKLPEDTNIEEVIAKELVLSLNLDVTSGITLDAFLISNPEFRGFSTEEKGLKEIIDGFLANDEEILQELQVSMMELDDIATRIVSGMIEDFKFLKMSQV